MRLLNHIPAWLKNKYALTAICFTVWIFFFDDRDVLTTQFKHRYELKDLEASRDYYKNQIEATQRELDQLRNDPALAEKYAREKYLMKRDNEDLFIVPE